MKFLAKLAEKRDLGGPKFQPQTSIRPQNQAQNVSPPGNTLLKKFILASGFPMPLFPRHILMS